MVDTKRKINAWIPLELYDNVVNAGYPKFTEAIIRGLELLLQDTERIHEDTSGYELLKADNSRLQAVCDELQAHNDTLKQDLQDLKAMHNNYMLQMQSLINQRAIEAPNPKKSWWKFW